MTRFLSIASLCIILILAGCLENEAPTETNGESPQNGAQLTSLSKAASDQFELVMTNLINSNNTDLSSAYPMTAQACGDSFDPDHQNEVNGEIVLEITPDDENHAQVIYNIDNVKYHSFRANVTFELPASLMQRLRAAIWTYGFGVTTANYPGDPANPRETQSGGFEIYPDNDQSHDYSVVPAITEYYDSPTKQFQDSTLYDFNQNQANYYFVTAEYRIDWHPRYYEFFINDVSVQKTEYSFASNSFMIPHVSYYWLPFEENCGSVTPAETYTMTVHDAEVYAYQTKPGRTLSWNGIRFGGVNFHADRFVFDGESSNNDGLMDDFIFYDGLVSSYQPLVGNFDANTNDYEVGYYNPSNDMFYFDRNSDGDFNDTDEEILYDLNQGIIEGDYIAIVGDWDNDGEDTPGLYRTDNATFYLSNDTDSPASTDINHTVTFGNAYSQPFAGDWNGDGIDDVGVRNGNEFRTTLSKRGTGTLYQPALYFGNSTGDIPVIGDWDNNGSDNFGVYRIADRRYWFTMEVSGSHSGSHRLDMDDECTVPLVWNP